MTPVYLETSALLRMLLGEEGGGETRLAISQADRVFASRLLRVEAERALIRLGLERPAEEGSIPSLQRHLQDFWPVVHFFEVTREVCELAGRVAPSSRLRTLDAIHLATFRSARALDPSTTLLSFDRRILEIVEREIDEHGGP